MSTPKKLLLIFGATGNQGGSIISTLLAHPTLPKKYTLRGITRDPDSARAQALTARGVEMVRADLDDPKSLASAARGAYGVFGITDFWAVMSKEREVAQGKNIFEACRTEGVRHFVWSSLPCAEKLTRGVLVHVDHFDGKAMVEEFVEAEKGEMIASYFMPAMFITFVKSQVKLVDGIPTISLPFPSDDIAWPLFAPAHDTGAFVLGLFEGGSSANGQRAHAVSAWTTPRDLVAALSRHVGREVKFNPIPIDTYKALFPDPVLAVELTETMRLVGEYSYYGKGEEKNQEKYDRWIVEGVEKIGLEQWISENGPWEFK